MEAYVDTPLANPTPVRLSTDRVSASPAVARTSPWATLLTFFCSDAVAFAAVWGLTYAVSNESAVDITRTASALGLIAAAFAFFGLYRSIPLHPAQELQRICLAVTMTFAVFCYLAVPNRQLRLHCSIRRLATDHLSATYISRSLAHFFALAYPGGGRLY